MFVLHRSSIRITNAHCPSLFWTGKGNTPGKQWSVTPLRGCQLTQNDMTRYSYVTGTVSLLCVCYIVIDWPRVELQALTLAAARDSVEICAGG